MYDVSTYSMSTDRVNDGDAPYIHPCNMKKPCRKTVDLYLSLYLA